MQESNEYIIPLNELQERDIPLVGMKNYSLKQLYDIELAKKRLHCTAKDAGIIAQKTRQKKLALVHREDSSQESINLLKEEASKEFSNEIIVPKDGDSLGLN